MNRTGNTIKPGIERGDHHRWLSCFGERSEISQIRAEQSGRYRLTGTARQSASLHAGSTSFAKIGFEKRGQSNPSC